MAIDIGRGLAVLIMILVHTMWMYGSTQTQSASVLGHVIHFLGKGTPAFLLAMGCSFVLSTRRGLKSDLLRGILILGFGYGMNFLKFIVPISIFGTMPESFIAAYGWKSPLDFEQLRYLLLTGDILQMAGVSLLLLAFVRCYVQSKRVVLALALLVLGISREVSGLRPGIDGLDYVADLFVASSYHVYFPVFPWMSFILLGLALGMEIRERDYDYRAVFSRIMPVGIACAIVGGGLCLWAPAYHWGDFFHLGPGGVIYLLGVNLVLLHLIHRLVERHQGEHATRAAWWFRLLSYASARVTSLYVIQWVLIAWGMGIIGFQTLSPAQSAALMPFTVAATFAVQALYERVATGRRVLQPVRPEAVA